MLAKLASLGLVSKPVWKKGGGGGKPRWFNEHEPSLSQVTLL